MKYACRPCGTTALLNTRVAPICSICGDDMETEDHQHTYLLCIYMDTQGEQLMEGTAKPYRTIGPFSYVSEADAFWYVNEQHFTKIEGASYHEVWLVEPPVSPESTQGEQP